jgi:anaerobic selenocysteine-containing dehydrogenase
MADHWVPTWPGSEPALFLAWANMILQQDLYHREFMESQVNWEQYLKAVHPDAPCTFETFIDKLKEEYAQYTPEYAAEECRIPVEQVIETGNIVANSGTALSSHVWRAAFIGNLGGWQVSRTLHFLNVLTGSVGTKGGTAPNTWSKFKPELPNEPPAPDGWNELHFPPEYTLSHFEMSHILPHLVKEGRGTMDVYFTRVFNPVWTYPDGFSWIEMLQNEEAVGCHIAMTPTWNETAFFADYVLPMGHASERHDINSYATSSGKWVAFRQPVLREYERRQGNDVEFTYEVNPGEVWEEDEFWNELSHRIDPDGSMGIKKYFMSPNKPEEKMSIDDYYQYIFERVPGLSQTAEEEGLSELEYMRRHGAYQIEDATYNKHEKEGWPTPSGKQEFYSETMIEFGYPEHAIPHYKIKSHVHPENLQGDDEFCLLPNFRLPMHIHSRSANAKWLVEIAHRNPIWLHPSDAKKLGVEEGGLLKIETEIGWFIDKVWVTEAIKPGIVGCSHHIGRWRRQQDAGNRMMTNTVSIEDRGDGKWRMRTVEGIVPFESSDPDTNRLFWRDGGVH